jgi:DNA N-6-adenine-methyltransferase (Dam)/Helix-turn-helix domain of resolvase
MSGNEWYTPKEHIERARTCMGSIDLDPASCDKAQRTVKASHYYTKETDGFAQPWLGRLFLNPPYSKHLITRFIDKLIAELPAIEQAIVLTDARTDTRWFRTLMAVSTVCLTHGRVHFINASGEPGTPTIGSAFFYVGHNPKRFAKVFAEVGRIVKPVQKARSELLTGQVRRPAHRPIIYSPFQLERVQQLRKEGMSVREIAECVALTKSTVWNILNS